MLAARRRIPGIALMEVELQEAALGKRLRNAVVQLVGEWASPRVCR